MSNPSEEVMKLARDLIVQTSNLVEEGWIDEAADIIARALTADRASCQARVEALELALLMIQHDASRYSGAHPYFVRIADAARSALEGK